MAALLIYAALTVFHLMQGFNLPSALGGVILDLRVVGMCFGEWGEMEEFIARDSYFGGDIGKMALGTAEECGDW